MSEKSQTIKRATVGIALLVLLSKGIGFFREMIIAYRFGTGIDYDIYLVAVSVPVALFSLFGYAFSNLFIPGYSYAVSGDDVKAGLSKLWSDFNLSLLAALLTTLAIIALAPSLIRFIAPGLKSRYLPEAVFIVRFSSIIAVMAVFEAFFRSVLNAEKRFLIPAAGPLLANSILIISIVSLAGEISTRAILYGLVFGYLGQVILVLIPFRRLKIVRFIHFRFIHRHSGKFLSVAAIILIIEGASQVYAIIDRYFASSMSPGIISSLGYSNLLVMLPVAIFAYALSTALFPYMTDAFARADRQKAGSLLSRGISVSLLMALPATIIVWVFSREIVFLLFRRGAFDMQSVAYTSGLLKYLSLSLAGQFLLWVMSRAYYAAKKYWVLIIHVVVLCVKAALAVLAVNAYGYIGLAVSSSISYTIGAILLIAFAGKVLAGIDLRGVLLYVVKVVVASGVGYLAAGFAHGWLVADQDSLGRLLIGLPVAILLTLMAVLIAGYFLKIPDVRDALNMILHRMERSGDEN